MALLRNMSFSGSDQSAALTLYVDGVPVTTYSYIGGQVTLSARPNDADLDLTTLTDNTAQIVEWLNGITKWLSVPAYSQGNFIYRTENEPERITAKYVTGGGEAIDARYNKSTHLIKFKARPQITMGLGSFRMFTNTLLCHLRGINNAAPV